MMPIQKKVNTAFAVPFAIAVIQEIKVGDTGMALKFQLGRSAEYTEPQKAMEHYSQSNTTWNTTWDSSPSFSDSTRFFETAFNGFQYGKKM